MHWSLTRREVESDQASLSPVVSFLIIGSKPRIPGL